MQSLPHKPVGVSTYDWETDSYTYNAPAMDPAQIWRSAVALAATKARQALPECTTRIDKAIELVLNNAVELLDNGTAKVTSQSNGRTAYVLTHGTCECADHLKAPQQRKRPAYSPTVVHSSPRWCSPRCTQGFGQANSRP